MKVWHWLLIAGGVAVLIGGGAKVYEMTRGIRNNNPGNIRHNPANAWRGQTGKDSAGFAIFDTATNGIRALAKLLTNYMNSGTNTVRKIVTKYAPAIENDTAAYIDAVAKRLAVAPDFPLAAYHLEPLVKAIIHHENGMQFYSENEIKAGIAAARV